MRKHVLIGTLTIIIGTTACLSIATPNGTPSQIPPNTSTPTNTATPLPSIPVEPGASNPSEPVLITGSVPYTSPFFLDSVAEAFVMLEDQAGFIRRNLDYEFPLSSQMLGPVEIDNDDQLTYRLNLPSIPQGTSVDIDNNGKDDPGVQVFAVAYWSNTWGGPFLEKRDGTGWSTVYASTITDPDLDYEITGGKLIVWSPDDKQGFPTGFGVDGKLFTDDDPTAVIPPGYSLVSLEQDTFTITKDPEIKLDLFEGALEVNDFSSDNYIEAFEKLFAKVSVEYPFTNDKSVNWQNPYDIFNPQIREVSSAIEFFTILHEFALMIPDGHIGISFTDTVSQLFFELHGGSFGMILTELSDGSTIVKTILPDTPAEQAGILPGAEILSWNNLSITDAISDAVSFFGPYSTEHHERLEKVIFLTRVPVGEEIMVTYQNPGDQLENSASLIAVVEYDSLFEAIPSFNMDNLILPVEATIFEDLNLAYIQITTFSDDYNLSAQLWDRHIEEIINYEVDGLILDIRVNGGGNSGLARDFAGYFFNDRVDISKRSYYNYFSKSFDYKDPISYVEPGPKYFDGPIAILVSPYCISACEGFAYTLSQRDNTYIVGHFPTAGAYGEVGRGQYNLPDDFSMQFPTGRSETMSGELLIEGIGVIPDILVPVTREAVLGDSDVVLSAAIDLLIK